MFQVEATGIEEEGGEGGSGKGEDKKEENEK
jgi:hypothetical protein